MLQLKLLDAWSSFVPIIRGLESARDAVLPEERLCPFARDIREV